MTTGERPAAALFGGVGLLERAITYTLGTLHAVTPDALSRPTPCRAWDLGGLLRHLDDSFTVLLQAVEAGQVEPASSAASAASAAAGADDDPVAALRGQAARLIGAWTNADDRLVRVDGCPVTAAIVASTGAIEIAVHGWDVARACGLDRPIPPPLAEELLDLCPLLVTDAQRPGHFGPPVDLPSSAAPGDRLVAFLGRDPTPVITA